jgi:solute carrier family 45 protein 1/2/4
MAQAQWQGTPHVKGSSESMRMLLLTFSLIGLQYVQLSKKAGG